MNFRKAALGLSIMLGIVVGGVFTYTSGTTLLGGIIIGAILGAVAFFATDWIIARRRTRLQPYDNLDEHQKIGNSARNQDLEARLRLIQDTHIDQYMPFQHPKR